MQGDAKCIQNFEVQTSNSSVRYYGMDSAGSKLDPVVDF
jgi:hypothetical protein